MPLANIIQEHRRRVVRRIMRLILRPAKNTDDGKLPATGIYRILVCRSVQTLGDSLALTPLLQELSEAYPGAEIDVTSRCPAAQLIYGSLPGISRVLLLPRHVLRNPLAALRVLRSMRRIRYDLVVDADPQSQSGRLLALLSRAERSLGFSGQAKAGTMTFGVEPPRELRHRAMLPVYLLRAARGDFSPRHFPPLDIRLDAGERENGRAVLSRILAQQGDGRRQKNCIGIFANATGDKLLARAWWERFLKTFEGVLSGYRIIEILPASAHSHLGDRYPGYYSHDARKLAALLSNLALFISADCGVMHLAAASGIPTIGVFTVTDPDEWGPYGSAGHAVLARDRTPEQVAASVLQVMAVDSARAASQTIISAVSR
jgi:ADP-heptose:LPS heptosyltransferase